MLTFEGINDLLKNRYPKPEDLDNFPFSSYLAKLWENSEYKTHGPQVLKAMEHLLSNSPEKIVRAGVPISQKQVENLNAACGDVLNKHFPGWKRENICAFFRICVIYHDIGKYIIKDRHPSLGWYIIQHLDPDEKSALMNIFPSEAYFRLLAIVIRDHDQFGVLNTGEASYPILLRATRSMGNTPQDQGRILSALMFFNLADMAGSFPVDGESIEKVINDWRWMMAAIEHCYETAIRLEDYIIEESSRVKYTQRRILRLLSESARTWEKRKKELDDPIFVQHELAAVFGSFTALREFSGRFSRICKMDYGLRFFKALVEYCEGPRKKPDENRVLEVWARKRLSKEDVFYAVVAILQRITESYDSMTGDRDHPNLIGVELKELAPENAPEKTARIIELIVKSHYPGLAWMMNDVPAWHF